MGHERSTGLDPQLSSTVTPVFPVSFFDVEHESDKCSLATTVPETVMAEQVTKDVVKEAQSMGRPAPIDDTASTTNTPAANGELPSGPATMNSTTSKQTPTLRNATGADTAQVDNAHVLVKALGAMVVTTEEQKQNSASLQETEKAFLNGDSGEQAIADASGGSDTDISRPGSVDQSKQDGNHVRTNSMKKPSTFKSVSVTKNFLAKSAVSTPTARLGDKSAPVAPASTATLLTAKPRLVAKSGTGNAPRALGKVNGAGSGPDASKVWNKNQPVPLPPPKQFTDEELKQQYGIHLATRLQADEGGKEAKWADIDDDEDDWAPDTVQWMDGTKSSGAAAENEVPLAEEEEAKTVAKVSETTLDIAHPVQVATTHGPKPSVTGGIKTILKPGTHAQPATGKTSLVLKGQPEKPTLVAKPLASEKKSPWATLPPVEKVSPVQINPPVQQQPQQRFSQRESYGYDPMPSLPAKEIAPDDFNRTWRDDRGTRPELFNSQSGRYEPVNDMRRGSVRESSFRQQPSVLQRPSQDGPAEPSAAFQTSRSGGDVQTWGRRRNSSNVSGSNGRRMSFDRRPPDMPTGPVGIERRGSQSVNGADPLDSASSRQPSVAQATSPNVANAHPASPYGSVTSSAAHDLPIPITAPPAEDPVEVQKRLMTDKIERARLKKQQEREAEEKEEAERKERLAKRLAAMGPPKVKEQSPLQPTERSPRKDKAVPASLQSPPKPPVPTTDGEVAQYGMMKVHHAQPVKKSSPIEGSKPAIATESVPRSSSPAKVQSENQTRPPPASLGQQPAQSFENFARENEKARLPSEQSEVTAPGGPRPQGAQSGWQSAAPQPRPWTSQVWGPPPTKERALGNGTFGSAYDRGQSRSSSQQQLPAQPQPQPKPTPSVNLNIVPNLPNPQPTNIPSTTQSMHPQSGPLSAQAGASARPGPIGPPSGKGWGNFAAHIAQDDQNLAAKARQDRERLGGETFRPEIRETYKDQLGQSQTTLHDKVAGSKALPNSGAKKDEAVKLVHEGQSPQQTLSQGTPLQQSTGPRASRFFPRSTESLQPVTATSTKAESPPPPPETESHPAFTGSAGQPLVRLPKPSPVVRLPPAAAGGAAQAEAPVSMPPRGNPGLGARPLAMNPEWQARFNKLLEKPGTSPAQAAQAAQAASNRPAAVVTPTAPLKPGSLPVAASSKAALDVRGNAGLATVSLPSVPFKRNFADDRGKDVLTRKGTEVLFEDREFGSLPTVKLSKAPHLAANEVIIAPPIEDPVLSRFKRIENPFTQRRLEAFDLERTAQKVDVVIRICNMREAIMKSMPRGRRGPKANSQYNKPKRNNNVPNGTPSGGLKDRPRKPSQQSQNDRPSNSTRPTTNAWTNNNRSTSGSTPGHQATTWARRAAAPVH